MFNPSTQPRILFVTSEVTFIPAGSGKNSDYINLRSEGFADFPTDLIMALFERGVDVHVVQPDYRRIFAEISQSKPCLSDKKMSCERVHLTEDRVFFYSNSPESNYKWDNIKISLAFQREVINHILPLVQPDLIHCHDWMTGLIPAMAKQVDIPCLFTIQNSDTAKSFLCYIEDMGIDAAAFWRYLFFDRFPANYEETRETNPVDFLLSGISAANFVNISDPVFLPEMSKDRSPHSELLGQVLNNKLKSGCAAVGTHIAVESQHHIDLYEKTLHRSLINSRKDNFESLVDFSSRSKKVSKADKKAIKNTGNFNPLVLAG